MQYQIQSFTDPTAFFQRCSSFLLSNEALNCLGIGIIQHLINHPETYPDFYLWAILSGDHVVGCSWMTPPHPLGVTEMPADALRALFSVVDNTHHSVPAVVGPKHESDLFSAWMLESGRFRKKSMHQRIFRTEQATMPYDVPGSMRIAVESDRELLIDWNLRFNQECNLGNGVDRAKNSAEAAIRFGTRRLWLDRSRIVAMAGFGGQTPTGVRVNAVYTPHQFRGRGYATALVHHLTQELLNGGFKQCFLYTDLANPTSNSIYQKIGYSPVGDSSHHQFLPIESC